MARIAGEAQRPGLTENQKRTAGPPPPLPSGAGDPSAEQADPGVSEPGVSEPGVSGPGVSGPGVSGPGVSGMSKGHRQLHQRCKT